MTLEEEYYNTKGKESTLLSKLDSFPSVYNVLISTVFTYKSLVEFLITNSTGSLIFLSSNVLVSMVFISV